MPLLQRTFDSSPAWAFLCALAIFLSLLAGCKKDKSTDLIRIATELESKASTRDTVQEALSEVPKMILLDRRVAAAEIARQLNSWGTKQPPSKDWNPSPLVGTLPQIIAGSTWTEGLPKLEFDESHCDYLFQCQLMRNVDRWVLAQPYRDKLFAEWLEAQQKAMPEKERLGSNRR